MLSSGAAAAFVQMDDFFATVYKSTCTTFMRFALGNSLIIITLKSVCLFVECVCALASAKWKLSDQLNTRTQQQRKRDKMKRSEKKFMIQERNKYQKIHSKRFH